MLNKINISPGRQNLFVYFVLAVVTLAVFGQVNQFDFVSIDDSSYVTNNSYIQSDITLDNIRWAFNTKDTGIWNPLVWISFMFDYQLYGLNAGGYHVTNVILHILSTLLLFWLFNRMTKEIWKSAFVAALFALHPLHAESVAWISERKDVLSAFFWMLTLCFYVYYTEKPVIRRYLLVLFFFVCGLLSKPMVVTLPVIMILLDYWPLRRFESQKGNVVLWQLREKALFFILSAVVPIISLFRQQQGTSIEIISLNYRLPNAPISFVTYLEKTFWPHHLAILYPFSDNIPFWQVLSAVLLIIVISVFVILVIKRFPFLFVGWLWYAITILPVIGIIQIGNEAMADRYTYLPSIGIGIMLAWGIPILFPQEGIRKIILLSAGIIVLAILSFLTWQQCGYWKNSTTLLTHSLQVTKNNHLAHNNLGLALLVEGKAEEAINHYNQAILLQPNYAIAYNNRGLIYLELGQYPPAIKDLTKAIQLKPDYADAYYNMGITYYKLGQYQLSIENYNQAIRLKPNLTHAYNARGVSYFVISQYQQAIEDYTESIRMMPYCAECYFNRGITYYKLGQYQLAIENYNQAIRLKPNLAPAYTNSALAYSHLGNNELACRNLQKTCWLGDCQLLEMAKVKGSCR